MIILLFKLTFCLVALLVLSACANKATIHLYTRYMNDEQMTEISKAISQAGFKINQNQLEFPREVTNNTFVYSPFSFDPTAIERLMQALAPDIKIDSVQTLVSGNHYYKKNSLALFIIPEEGVQTGMVIKEMLYNQWASAQCELDVSLSLFEDGRYEFNNNEASEQDSALSKGRWLIRQLPYIELRPIEGESWVRYYELVHTQTQDHISKLDMLTLKPLQPHQVYGDCHFEFGLRYQ